jgi:Txe/YoeB family toxin of toxin-antitoxin system
MRLLWTWMNDPFKGLGKPEPLKHSLKGWWSRRITREHRLVYRVSGSAAARNSGLSLSLLRSAFPPTIMR